jgi:hypothetical protein
MRFVKTDWSPGYINVCPQHTVIMVECTACGVQKPFDRKNLPDHLHHSLITDIEPLLKCSCGAKAAKMLFGYYVE